MTEEASTYKRLKTVYSINGIGKLDRHMQKNELDHLLAPHTRINSKWIKDLNVRPKTLKILKENIGSKIPDIVCSNILSEIYPQAREKKKKNKQMGLHQTKNFCTVKESINKVKRQPTHGLGEHICQYI